MLRLTTAACLTALAVGLPAQEFTDTFSVPSTTGAPGWTSQVGNWSVSGGRLRTDGASVWSYITKDGYAALNCVIDLEAFYITRGVQFAGCAARFSTSSSTLVCKIQESSTTSDDFDQSWVYERGGTGSSPPKSATLTTSVSTSAVVRMIVCGSEVTMQHDFDRDGTFDQTIGPLTINVVTAAGLVGANLYSKSQIDNWKYFTAVLKPQAAATPKIGTTYKMDLVTRATTITPWSAAMSGGNAGFAIGARRLPLTLDAIFDLSLIASGALGLSGVTDSAGKATVNLQIPNSASLVGVTLFCAAVTADAMKPFGIGDISNEQAIKFVQ